MSVVTAPVVIAIELMSAKVESDETPAREFFKGNNTAVTRIKTMMICPTETLVPRMSGAITRTTAGLSDCPTAEADAELRVTTRKMRPAPSAVSEPPIMIRSHAIPESWTHCGSSNKKGAATTALKKKRTPTLW
jgi:hypothetical protein